MSLSWSVARQVSPKVSSFDIDCASPQTARTTMVYLINPLCIFLCTFCSSNQSNRKVSYWHFSSYLIARDLRWHWDLTLVFSADIGRLISKTLTSPLILCADAAGRWPTLTLTLTLTLTFNTCLLCRHWHANLKDINLVCRHPMLTLTLTKLTFDTCLVCRRPRLLVNGPSWEVAMPPQSSTRW